MKKICIKIAIIIGFCGALVGGYYYKAQAMETNMPSNVSKTNQINSQNFSKQSINTEQNKKNTNNNNSSTNIGEDNTQINSNDDNSISSKSTNNLNNTSNKINNYNNQEGSTHNQGTIEVIPPKFNFKFNPKTDNDVVFPLSTIIVKNTTDNPISNNMLYNVIKNWIFKWQYGREQFCVATGEDWNPQWFDAIPHSEVISAFIQANGQKALTQNISANEINKGAMLFTQQANSKPIPFTTKQATIYIQNMLNGDSKYYGENDIAKVVLHTYKNQAAGLYYVYTKQMLAKGYKEPFWYVYTNTGQATGV